MNIGQLKQLISDSGLPDTAEVLARDRDCINLDMIDIVGASNHILTGNGQAIYGSVPVHFRATSQDVYGGDTLAMDGIKKAIIFCDCD